MIVGILDKQISWGYWNTRVSETFASFVIRPHVQLKNKLKKSLLENTLFIEYL